MTTFLVKKFGHYSFETNQSKLNKFIRDKTMDDKFVYISNNDKQNYPSVY